MELGGLRNKVPRCFAPHNRLRYSLDPGFIPVNTSKDGVLSEVKLYFTFAASVAGISGTFGGANLWVDYIYLDVDERRRFAQVSHEYLIEQIQFTGDETVAVGTSGQKTSNIRLNFNHPTKYLAWVVSGSAYGQYASTAATGPVSSVVASAGRNSNGAPAADNAAPLYSAKLQLNGQDRFSARWGLYFNKVQPLQTVGSKPAAGVYLYSFALKPQEHQPSGTCNFSRIDNATLNLTFKTASVSGTGATGVTSNAVTTAGATALTALRVFAVNLMLGSNSTIPQIGQWIECCC